MSVYLHGLGHRHPDTEITNQFLEELDIGTNEAWIMERVGIRSRRSVLPLDYIRDTRNTDVGAAFEAAQISNAQLAAEAARVAVQRAGIEMADIGLVIAGSSASDTSSPAEACNIAAELELEVPAFDVNSACTSFFAPLWLLSMMHEDRLPPFILLAVPETLTKTVDYRDRASAVLWGDCAAAAVVSTREKGRAEILGSSLTSSPAGHDKVVVPRVGFFRQDGQAVQKFAIKETIRTLRGVQSEYTEPGRNLSFVGHQANLRMLEMVCRQCEVAPDRHHSNVVDFGNTAGAGSPSVMSQRWDQWTGSDDVAVVGVGAGLTWGSYLLRFS